MFLYSSLYLALTVLILLIISFCKANDTNDKDTNNLSQITLFCSKCGGILAPIPYYYLEFI